MPTALYEKTFDILDMCQNQRDLFDIDFDYAYIKIELYNMTGVGYFEFYTQVNTEPEITDYLIYVPSVGTVYDTKWFAPATGTWYILVHGFMDGSAPRVKVTGYTAEEEATQEYVEVIDDTVIEVIDDEGAFIKDELGNLHFNWTLDFGTLESTVNTGFSKMESAIVDSNSELGQGISTAIVDTSTTISEDLENLKNEIFDVGTKIGAVFSEAFSELGTDLENIFWTTTADVIDEIEKISLETGKLWADLLPKIADLFEDLLRRVLKYLWELFRDFFFERKG